MLEVMENGKIEAWIYNRPLEISGFTGRITIESGEVT
jgi:hypothetical protein